MVFDIDLRISQTLSLVLSPIIHANSLCVKSIEQTVLLANRTQGITPARTQHSCRKFSLVSFKGVICFIVDSLHIEFFMLRLNYVSLV